MRPGPRLIRRRALSLAAAAGAAALLHRPASAHAFQTSPPPCDQLACPGFGLAVHEDITADALREEGFGEWAIDQVILGVQGADLFHVLPGNYESRLHFHSNKREPTAAAALQRFRWLTSHAVLFDLDDRFTFDGDFALLDDLWDRIKHDRPFPDGRHHLPLLPYKDAPESLYIFGLLLHATQDFYAHTNYIVLELERKSSRDVELPRSFGLEAMPRRLESGFWVPIDPARKLPAAVERSLARVLGLGFLHDDLNYDTPDRPDFAIARRLAVEETRRAARRFKAVAPAAARRLL